MCAAAEPAPEPCVRPELPEDFGGRMRVKHNVIPALAEKRELSAVRRLNWVVTPSVGPFAGRAVFLS